MMRLRTSALALLALGPALLGSPSAGGAQSPTAFRNQALFNAGERVDGLPLVAVLRREGTAEFVSFVYGDCAARDDAGCAPPAEIQVWPACRRNLGLYDDALGTGLLAERTSVRGVPALLFDEGTRLELETGRSTVVVFADTPARLLRMAAALRALDESVGSSRPLPQPLRERGGDPMDC